MFEYYLSGAGLRLFETVVYSSIWVVIGCFIAAVFRRMLGPEKLRRIFANETRWGLAAGWLIGMLLPVCSLGVIPVVRELHRSGVNRGTIVAFGLTAPLFNPMSVLYGLTLSDPIAILSFSICALAIVSVVGFIWNRLTGGMDEQQQAFSPPTFGTKRTLSIFYTASKELTSVTMLFVLAGILGSVLLAVLVPKGFMQDQVERDNLLAPITIALMATPIYSTPLLAMSQIGSMFQHGNSIGAAFSLLILGAGTNIGLLAWFSVTYGIRRMVIFYVLMLVTTIGIAYAIDKPLYPKGVDPAGHSHAFDVYTHPFGQSEEDVVFYAKNKAVDFWNANEFGATYILGILLLVGLFFRFSGPKQNWEEWFCKENAKAKKGFDIIIPGWVLGVVTVLGLIAVSILSCYLYYPEANDLLGDLNAVNTECVLSARTQDWEAADKWIRYSDDLSRRLEVGVFLREGKVDEFKAMKAQIYREKLDILKESVAAQNPNNIYEISMDVSRAYLRMSAAFRDLKQPVLEEQPAPEMNPEAENEQPE